MKQKALSATYIKKYLQCLQAFYYRFYTDKRPAIFGDSRPFGIALHSALEYAYSRLSDTGCKPTQEDYDAVVRCFVEEAIKNNLDDQALYDEGRRIIKKKLDIYDPSEKVLGLEFKFGLPPFNPDIPVFTTNGTPLMGAIDKIFELNPETLVIVDYKTSNFALTPEEAATDVQLSMYDLVISKLFGGYKNIIVVLDYLRLEPVITHRTEEQRKHFEIFADEIYRQIGELKEEDIKPRLNEFCGWCDYKNMCPAYCKVINDPDLISKPLELLTDNEITDEWVRFNFLRKIFDSHKRNLETHVANLADNRDVSDISGSEYSLYRTQSSRMNYDVKTVYDIVPRDIFLSVASINKSALDKYLLDHPDLSREINKTSKVNFSTSYFRFKKSK